MTKKYKEFCDYIITSYNIELCNGTLCDNDWSRMHAHVKERRICKWVFKNSIQSVFDLLHEVGHIETTKSKMRRCESEYYATQWALDKAKELGLNIPESIILRYQNYIDREWDRGIRRGGNLPKLELLQLKI